jgi:hypothetical protein
MPRVIVPVGQFLGPRFRYVRPPDPVPLCHEVHLGDEQEELTEAEVAVWGSAAMNVERHAELEVNRDSLVKFLSAAPKPQPRAAEIVEELTGRGLLLEFDTDGDLEQVFNRYKLMPTGLGLGSTAEEPHRHRIGFPSQPIIAVPNDVYGLWSFSFLHPHLWDACAYYAAGDQEELGEGEEPLGLTPEGVAHDVAIHLPLMIAANCAFLDPVVLT